MSTTEAAAYLAERGYTISRRRAGGKGSPSGDTLKHWARSGRLEGVRKSGDRWLIPQQELDRLLATNVAANVANRKDNNSSTASGSEEIR